jgi:hypothetical protein
MLELARLGPDKLPTIDNDLEVDALDSILLPLALLHLSPQRDK